MYWWSETSVDFTDGIWSISEIQPMGRAYFADIRDFPYFSVI
jgi:hypothetical protein